MDLTTFKIEFFTYDDVSTLYKTFVFDLHNEYSRSQRFDNPGWLDSCSVCNARYIRNGFRGTQATMVGIKVQYLQYGLYLKGNRIETNIIPSDHIVISTVDRYFKNHFEKYKNCISHPGTMKYGIELYIPVYITLWLHKVIALDDKRRLDDIALKDWVGEHFSRVPKDLTCMIKDFLPVRPIIPARPRLLEHNTLGTFVDEIAQNDIYIQRVDIIDPRYYVRLILPEKRKSVSITLCREVPDLSHHYDDLEVKEVYDDKVSIKTHVQKICEDLDNLPIVWNFCMY